MSRFYQREIDRVAYYKEQPAMPQPKEEKPVVVKKRVEDEEVCAFASATLVQFPNVTVHCLCVCV
jgi:hypothetical protein